MYAAYRAVTCHLRNTHRHAFRCSPSWQYWCCNNWPPARYSSPEGLFWRPFHNSSVLLSVKRFIDEKAIASDSLLQKIYVTTLPKDILMLAHEYKPYLTEKHVIALIEQLAINYQRKRILSDTLTELDVKLHMPVSEDFYQEQCLQLYACLRRLTIHQLENLVGSLLCEMGNFVPPLPSPFETIVHVIKMFEPHLHRLEAEQLLDLIRILRQFKVEDFYGRTGRWWEVAIELLSKDLNVLPAGVVARACHLVCDFMTFKVFAVDYWKFADACFSRLSREPCLSIESCNLILALETSPPLPELLIQCIERSVEMKPISEIDSFIAVCAHLARLDRHLTCNVLTKILRGIEQNMETLSIGAARYLFALNKPLLLLRPDFRHILARIIQQMDFDFLASLPSGAGKINYSQEVLEEIIQRAIQLMSDASLNSCRLFIEFLQTVDAPAKERLSFCLEVTNVCQSRLRKTDIEDLHCIAGICSSLSEFKMLSTKLLKDLGWRFVEMGESGSFNYFDTYLFLVKTSENKAMLRDTVDFLKRSVMFSKKLQMAPTVLVRCMTLFKEFSLWDDKLPLTCFTHLTMAAMATLSNMKLLDLARLLLSEDFPACYGDHAQEASSWLDSYLLVVQNRLDSLDTITAASLLHVLSQIQQQTSLITACVPMLMGLSFGNLCGLNDVACTNLLMALVIHRRPAKDVALVVGYLKKDRLESIEAYLLLSLLGVVSKRKLFPVYRMALLPLLKLPVNNMESRMLIPFSGFLKEQQSEGRDQRCAEFEHALAHIISHHLPLSYSNTNIKDIASILKASGSLDGRRYVEKCIRQDCNFLPTFNAMDVLTLVKLYDSVKSLPSDISSSVTKAFLRAPKGVTVLPSCVSIVAADIDLMESFGSHLAMVLQVIIKKDMRQHLLSDLLCNISGTIRHFRNYHEDLINTLISGMARLGPQLHGNVLCDLLHTINLAHSQNRILALAKHFLTFCHSPACKVLLGCLFAIAGVKNTQVFDEMLSLPVTDTLNSCRSKGLSAFCLGFFGYGSVMLGWNVSNQAALHKESVQLGLEHLQEHKLKESDHERMAGDWSLWQMAEVFAVEPFIHPPFVEPKTLALVDLAIALDGQGHLLPFPSCRLEDGLQVMNPIWPEGTKYRVGCLVVGNADVVQFVSKEGSQPNKDDVRAPWLKDPHKPLCDGVVKRIAVGPVKLATRLLRKTGWFVRWVSVDDLKWIRSLSDSEKRNLLSELVKGVHSPKTVNILNYPRRLDFSESPPERTKSESECGSS